MSKAHNADADHRCIRLVAHIVGQAQLRVLYLALPGPAQQLQVELINHPYSRSTDRVPKTLEPSVRLHRQCPGHLEESGLDVLLNVAPLAELEILHGDSLGNRETIVDLGHAYFLPRFLDPRFLVGGDAATVGLLKGGEGCFIPWLFFSPRSKGALGFNRAFL